MRIISGIHKGRRLRAPKNLPVRPTTDRAKEALFNIIANRFNITELEVLDLFTGIGSISFEFASRGAEKITSVEIHHKCCAFLKKTIEELDLNCHLIKKDALEYTKHSMGKYDIIFADPPYDFSKEVLEDLIKTVFDRELLKSEDSLLIIEHSKFIELNNLPNFIEERRYGLSNFSFFKKVLIKAI